MVCVNFSILLYCSISTICWSTHYMSFLTPILCSLFFFLCSYPLFHWLFKFDWLVCYLILPLRIEDTVCGIVFLCHVVYFLSPFYLRLRLVVLCLWTVCHILDLYDPKSLNFWPQRGECRKSARKCHFVISYHLSKK